MMGKVLERCKLELEHCKMGQRPGKEQVRRLGSNRQGGLMGTSRMEQGMGRSKMLLVRGRLEHSLGQLGRS